MHTQWAATFQPSTLHPIHPLNALVCARLRVFVPCPLQRNIQLRQFRGIPMADLEMIMPEKKVGGVAMHLKRERERVCVCLPGEMRPSCDQTCALPPCSWDGPRARPSALATPTTVHTPPRDADLRAAQGVCGDGGHAGWRRGGHDCRWVVVVVWW